MMPRKKQTKKRAQKVDVDLEPKHDTRPALRIFNQIVHLHFTREEWSEIRQELRYKAIKAGVVNVGIYIQMVVLKDLISRVPEAEKKVLNDQFLSVLERKNLMSQGKFENAEKYYGINQLKHVFAFVGFTYVTGELTEEFFHSQWKFIDKYFELQSKEWKKENAPLMKTILKLRKYEDFNLFLENAIREVDGIDKAFMHLRVSQAFMEYMTNFKLSDYKSITYKRTPRIEDISDVPSDEIIEPR